MMGTVARDLGRVKKVVNSMFEGLGQVTRREVEVLAPMNRLLFPLTLARPVRFDFIDPQDPGRGKWLRYSSL